MPIKFKMLKMDGCASGGYVGGLGGYILAVRKG